jgi:putative DNA primase/helicase
MTLDLYALRERLGGEVTHGGSRWLGPGPGHSRRDRSLSVRVTEDGQTLVHSFAGDTLRVCREYLGLQRDVALALPPRSKEAEVKEPDARALSIWRKARPIGEIVAAYFQSRGVTIPVPPSLRQGVGLAIGGTPTPTLVAAVSRPDGRIIAVQQLRLTWKGCKAPASVQRVTTGRLWDGAVRLAAADEALGLAGGVETALSAMQLSGVPTWATLGAERLSLTFVPPRVRELHVFADADQAGERAAVRAAERHVRRGLTVHIRCPPEGSADWNDVLRNSASKSR